MNANYTGRCVSTLSHGTLRASAVAHYTTLAHSFCALCVVAEARAPRRPEKVNPRAERKYMHHLERLLTATAAAARLCVCVCVTENATETQSYSWTSPVFRETGLPAAAAPEVQRTSLLRVIAIVASGCTSNITVSYSSNCASRAESGVRLFRSYFPRSNVAASAATLVCTFSSKSDLLSSMTRHV